MKNKQILILAVILLAFITGIIIQNSHQRPELTTEEYVPLDLSFNADAVNKVTITKDKPGAPSHPQVILVKNKGNWIIPGLWSGRADKDKIQKFFEEIKKAKGELRGKGKEIFSDFSIADDQGFQISLFDAAEKEILGFVIGTKKAGYGAFVRKKGAESVYLTEANLYGQMGVYGDPEAENVPLDYWALKNFAFFDPGRVTKIEMRKFENGSESGSYVISHEKEGWQYQGVDIPFSISPERVSQYLSNLKGYSAQTVVSPEKDYGFSKPQLRLVLTMDSGDPLELTVGDPDPKDKNKSAFAVKVSGEPAVFLVSKFYLENISAEPIWFLPDNLLQVDSSKIEKLVIHANQTEMSFQPTVKKWDSLTNYMDKLKNMRAQNVASGKPRFGKYWIELKKQGDSTSTIIDIADAANEKREYPAKKRGSQFTFGISETVFRDLFDNLSLLNPPATTAPEHKAA